jgi:hypothetical protein
MLLGWVNVPFSAGLALLPCLFAVDVNFFLFSKIEKDMKKETLLTDVAVTSVLGVREMKEETQLPDLAVTEDTQVQDVAVMTSPRKHNESPPGRGASGPQHLFILMHGVMGRQSHMSALADAAKARMGQGVLIFSTSSYSRLYSLRGTRYAGNAVFAEIQELVRKHAGSLKYISLCGYSFGGIVAMWVSALLYEHTFLGLQPINFMTIACPHLGLDPSPSGYLQVLKRTFIRNAGVHTGSELSHADGYQLLLHLTHPSSAGYKGLQAFARRATYANIRCDRTVPFETAFFPSPDLPSVLQLLQLSTGTQMRATWQSTGLSYPHVFQVRCECKTEEELGGAAAAGEGGEGGGEDQVLQGEDKVLQEPDLEKMGLGTQVALCCMLLLVRRPQVLLVCLKASSGSMSEAPEREREDTWVRRPRMRLCVLGGPEVCYDLLCVVAR